MQRKIGILFSVLFFVLSGCSILIADDGNKTSCLDIDSIPTPNVDNNYRYYVVLVEGSEEYKPYRDQGLSVLSKVLSYTLEPGDRNASIWMEVSSLGSDDALFFSSEVENFPLPNLVSEPIPTYLPIPTPLNGGETPASKRQHENEVDEINEKNEEIQREHNCKFIFPIREDNNKRVDDWNKLNEDEVTRIIDDLSLNANSSNPDYMSVFEALKLASDIFNEVCVNGVYDDCQLIIISDMVDWRSTLDTPEVTSSIQKMNIDFSAVSVSVIWPDCEFFSDQFKSQCESRKEIWEKHFSVFNATENKNNLVFINMNNAIERLKTFIGE